MVYDLPWGRLPPEAVFMWIVDLSAVAGTDTRNALHVGVYDIREVDMHYKGNNLNSTSRVSLTCIEMHGFVIITKSIDV